MKRLKKYGDGGKVKPPIYTSDKGKVQAYNDSLNLYNQYMENIKGKNIKRDFNYSSGSSVANVMKPIDKNGNYRTYKERLDSPYPEHFKPTGFYNSNVEDTNPDTYVKTLDSNNYNPIAGFSSIPIYKQPMQPYSLESGTGDYRAVELYPEHHIYNYTTQQQADSAANSISNKTYGDGGKIKQNAPIYKRAISNIQRLPIGIPYPDQINPQQVQVPNLPPIVGNKEWYSNSQNIPYDAEDMSKLYNEDGTRKYQQGGTINNNSMKKKGCSIPGYERGGYASYENGNRGISQLGSIIDMATNNNMDYPNPIPHQHPVYRVQNSMMANGGYLGYMQSNPQGGGVMYTEGVRTHQSPQPHGGSNMNGSSWSKYGGEIGYLPAPLEYAYLQQGGHVDGYPYYNSSVYPYEDGGQVDEMKSGGWLKGAINPAHKGYCTPMTKSTCTPKRRAFAMTMKKHHGFHEYGGPLRKFVDGGETIPPMEPSMPQSLPTPMPPAPGMPGAYTPPTIPQDQMPQAPPPVFNDESFRDDDRQPQRRQQPIGTGFNNLLGAGLAATSYFEDRRNARNAAGYARQQGMSDNAFKSQELNTQGNRGNYSSQGVFRPNEMTPGSTGMYYPQRQYGGYQTGGYTAELPDHEIQALRAKGYKIEYI